MLQFILLLYLLWIPQTPAESPRLEKLVQERDQLHSQWKASESRKSGIFGNRTKKDMIETNEWLERILNKDNQIMDELRMIGAIESTTISQEKEDYKAITIRLERDIQALKRALAERDKTIQNQLSGKRGLEWTTMILFLSTAGLGYWIYRTKRN